MTIYLLLEIVGPGLRARLTLSLPYFLGCPSPAAAVVRGNVPVYGCVGMISPEHPEISPHLNAISFFFKYHARFPALGAPESVS